MPTNGFERRWVTCAASTPGTLPETAGCSRATLEIHRRAPERAYPNSAWCSQCGLLVLGPASFRESGRAYQGCDQGAHTPCRFVEPNAPSQPEDSQSSPHVLPHPLPCSPASLPPPPLTLHTPPP